MSKIPSYTLIPLALLLFACSRPADPTLLPGPTPEPVFPPAIEIRPLVDAGQMITALVNAGDGSGRLFLTTRSGLIFIIKDGKLRTRPFLDLVDIVDNASIEQGLLGLAFDPFYESNGEFYVYYTSLPTEDDTVVRRYRASADPDRADPDSGQELLFVEQPANNHNAGQLAFGPEGYLYIGLGDGGPGNDPKDYAQNPGVLLGKILRVDVRGQETYAIPPDNPFVDRDGFRPEIWAYGLRNPWRFSFDSETGDFFLGDVGQETWEELNFVENPGRGGMNFGWNIFEGLHCFKASRGCDDAGLTQPIFDYQHGETGCSITGGYVYRGELYPELWGTYFFGDFCTGMIWGARRGPGGEWQISELLDTDLAIASFGESETGELFVLDLYGGVYSLKALR